MKTIYKYQLKIADYQEIKMPCYAKILTVKLQNGIPNIWALVDPETSSLFTRKIRMAGTGHPVEDDAEYIGTILIHSDTLVFHIFELK